MDFDYNVRGNLGLGNPINTILQNRGISNTGAFLNPSKKNMENAHLLDNIDLAVDVFLNHMNKGSTVTVLQDCDCDGITSAAVMILYINEHFPKIKVDYIIHNGKEHGLDSETMSKIITSMPDFLIIPDAGSNDLRELKKLKQLGIDVIVLDHHDKSKKTARLQSIYHLDDLNEFGVIVNNQFSTNVKDKSMTGVGIVYKFCSVIDERLGTNTVNKYLDLVALGMIADICDLTQLQTRYLVLEGIKQIQEATNENKFISELVKSQAFVLHNKATILGIGWYIAPLINSLIRLGTPDDKQILMKAFLNDTSKVVMKIRGKGEQEISIQECARRLCEKYKRNQKKLTEEYTNILITQVEEYDLNSYPVICCKASDDFANTFTGLIANKLKSLYQKPSLVLRENENILVGSARGFEESRIKDIKSFCQKSKLFKLVEGHPNACGVHIKIDKISEFYEYLAKQETDNKLHYDVDAKFTNSTLNAKWINLISEYSEVWGNNIVEPLFAIELTFTISDSNFKLIGADKTTIKILYQNIEIIKFKTTEAEYKNIKCLGSDIKFIIIGKFSINEFRGNKTPQIVVENWQYEVSKSKSKFRF